MSELPEAWQTLRLGEVAARTSNVDPSKSPVEEFELYSVPSFAERRPELTAGADIRSAKQAVQPDDVLLCKIVPHINRVWVVGTKSDRRQIASGEWIVYRDHGCDPNYLRYCLTEQSFRDRFMQTVAGVGGSLMRARPSEVAEIEVPLAPLAEQRRIVAKIDSLTGKSRRARDHLDHIPRLVENYKQAVLAAAFRGDLTREWRAERGLSATYRTACLADVLADIRYGTAKKCTYHGGATPVLRIPNVQNGEIALDDLKSADFEEAELRKLRLQQGDLLVIRSNGSLGLVGRCAIVNEAAAEMLFAGYLIRLRLDTETILPRYAHLWLQSGSMRSVIEGLAKSTSGVNNINSTQIEQLPIKLTGLDEQAEIVRRIDAAFLWIDRLASEATSARRLIDRLDQAVLAKAFRGELVPQDPDDEPASVLLERIRGERGPAPKAKRGRRAKAV